MVRKEKEDDVHPPLGTIRINCDALWCKQISMGGGGVVARDSNSEVVGGMNRRYRSDDVKTLEASAIL